MRNKEELLYLLKKNSKYGVLRSTLSFPERKLMYELCKSNLAKKEFINDNYYKIIVYYPI